MLDQLLTEFGLEEFFKRKYRVVPGNYRGYKVQSKFWFCPFYFDCFDIGRICNDDHDTIEIAKKFIDLSKINGTVYHD